MPGGLRGRPSQVPWPPAGPHLPQGPQETLGLHRPCLGLNTVRCWRERPSCTELAFCGDVPGGGDREEVGTFSGGGDRGEGHLSARLGDLTRLPPPDWGSVECLYLGSWVTRPPDFSVLASGTLSRDLIFSQ